MQSSFQNSSTINCKQGCDDVVLSGQCVDGLIHYVISMGAIGWDGHGPKHKYPTRGGNKLARERARVARVVVYPL